MSDIIIFKLISTFCVREILWSDHDRVQDLRKRRDIKLINSNLRITYKIVSMC